MCCIAEVGDGWFSLVDSFAFLPFVDLPLMAVALLALLWHFNRWASHPKLTPPLI